MNQIQLDAFLDEHASEGQSALLPALQLAQKSEGFISEPIAAKIARALRVPLADVHGVISFFSLFYNVPTGQTIVRVCADPACAMRGADDILVRAKQTASDMGETTVERAPCLGLCADAVAVNVSRVGQDDMSYARVTIDNLDAVFQGGGFSSPNHVGGDIRILTALCGGTRAATLREYENAGGFSALQKVLREWSPKQLIDEVKASGLVGRGGAAFPTGAKWEACANATGETKYVVVNADESEPGTFKDRVMLENDPNRVLEGAMLAAYAIGASKIYFYIRGEYPLATQRVRSAIKKLCEVGYLGKNIFNSNFSIDVELRNGAGAYICGEETALFESIEGKRGFPRIKPPFPVTHGLFGKPTAINNVETLAAVPTIVSRSAVGYRQIGTEKSPGSKLFCVSGDVARPGVYEVAFGTTIRRLLELAGGGVGPLQAILLGGAAGAFATEKDLDVKLSFEDLRAAGLPLGSGVVMVFNQSRDLRDILARLAHFFAHESCGKCYPCQLGTQRQFDILERVRLGDIRKSDIDALSDIGWTMTDASLCGLGQTAASAVRSAMKVFPNTFFTTKTR